MDAITAIGMATTAVKLLIQLEPTVVQGFKDIKGYAIALAEKWTGKPLTEEHRSALEDQIDEMHNRFQNLTRPNVIDESHPNAFTDDQTTSLAADHPNIHS